MTVYVDLIYREVPTKGKADTMNRYHLRRVLSTDEILAEQIIKELDLKCLRKWGDERGRHLPKIELGAAIGDEITEGPLEDSGTYMVYRKGPRAVNQKSFLARLRDFQLPGCRDLPYYYKETVS